MTESKQTISWEKEGHIFCGFRFSSSFQKIDMILLTRPEGGLIGLISLIRVRRIFLPKKKSVSTPSVSFIHQWRFPCRRGTRVNISTPFIPVHVTFEYSASNYTGSTDKEHRLFQSTTNP